MLKWNSLLLNALCFLLFVLFFPTHAMAWDGAVVGVTDGDTITVLDSQKRLHKIRLYGIDCPEKKQPFGQKAKQYASDLAFKQIVEVEEITKDRYGRTIALVILPGGQLLNSELIRAGLAWVYTRYCKRAECREWSILDKAAKESQIGLWSDPHAMPPWKWRKKK